MLFFMLGLLLNLGTTFLSIQFLAGTFLTEDVCNFNYVLPSALIRALSVVRIPVRWSERLTNHNLTLRISKELRINILKKILSVRSNLLGCKTTLLDNLIRDAEVADQFHLRLLLPPIGGLLLATIAGTVLFLLRRGSFVTFGIATLLSFLGSILLSFLGEESSAELITWREAQYRQALSTLIVGNAELSLYRFVSVHVDRLRMLELSRFMLQKEQLRRRSATRIGVVLLIGILLIPAIYLAFSPLLDVSYPSAPTLFTFLTAITLLEMLTGIPVWLQHLRRFGHSSRRMDEIIGRNSGRSSPTARVDLPGSRDLRIDVRRLRFSYPGGGRAVIDDLSLRIKPGERIAILGHTGSGKSTLIRLLIRFLDPDGGEIRFNDRQLSSLSVDELRNLVAVVPQKIHVFSATLRENLILADRDVVDDKHLIKMLEELRLEDLLSGRGLDSLIGNGGRQLSGGERRRLGIARVLLKRRARLWLFDEPTEDLDRCGVRYMLNLVSCSRILDGRTVIVVTHRPDLLERMDLIHVMDDGTLLERGTHEQLIKRRGRYHDCRQLLDREVAFRFFTGKKFNSARTAHD